MTNRARRIQLLLPVLVVSSVLLSGCGDDDSVWVPRGSSLVTLAFQDLAPLPEGLNYQAWVVESRNTGFWGGTLGMFNVNENGEFIDPSTGAVISGTFEAGLDAQDVFGVQISIEMSDVPVNQPSATFILGGVVAGGVAELGQAHWLSMTADFSGMSGSYFLATPTDDQGDNELSGVWFADNSSGTPAQGLFLPQAPDGWDYEAWVAMGGDTLSTGKFYLPTIADTTNLYGGPTGQYAFPGQDFIRNAPDGMTFPRDLSGASVFVTLEPWEEYDVEPLSPFGFFLLEADIPMDASAGTTYPMNSRINVLPRGTATVSAL